jgi:hypothetical protein
MDKQIRKCFNNILTSSSFSTIGRFVWNRNKNRNYLAARKQRSDFVSGTPLFCPHMCAFDCSNRIKTAFLCEGNNFATQKTHKLSRGVLEPGLWIRIDLIRIRIQHFSSIRIRIYKVTESGSNPDPDPQPWLEHKECFRESLTIKR